MTIYIRSTQLQWFIWMLVMGSLVSCTLTSPVVSGKNHINLPPSVESDQNDAANMVQSINIIPMRLIVNVAFTNKTTTTESVNASDRPTSTETIPIVPSSEAESKEYDRIKIPDTTGTKVALKFSFQTGAVLSEIGNASKTFVSNPGLTGNSTLQNRFLYSIKSKMGNESITNISGTKNKECNGTDDSNLKLLCSDLVISSDSNENITDERNHIEINRADRSPGRRNSIEIVYDAVDDRRQLNIEPSSEYSQINRDFQHHQMDSTGEFGELEIKNTNIDDSRMKNDKDSTENNITERLYKNKNDKIDSKSQGTNYRGKWNSARFSMKPENEESAEAYDNDLINSAKSYPKIQRESDSKRQPYYSIDNFNNEDDSSLINSDSKEANSFKSSTESPNRLHPYHFFSRSFDRLSERGRQSDHAENEFNSIDRDFDSTKDATLPWYAQYYRYLRPQRNNLQHLAVIAFTLSNRNRSPHDVLDRTTESTKTSSAEQISPATDATKVLPKIGDQFRSQISITSETDITSNTQKSTNIITYSTTQRTTLAMSTKEPDLIPSTTSNINTLFDNFRSNINIPIDINATAEYLLYNNLTITNNETQDSENITLNAGFGGSRRLEFFKVLSSVTNANFSLLDIILAICCTMAALIALANLVAFLVKLASRKRGQLSFAYPPGRGRAGTFRRGPQTNCGDMTQQLAIESARGSKLRRCSLSKAETLHVRPMNKTLGCDIDLNTREFSINQKSESNNRENSITGMPGIELICTAQNLEDPWIHEIDAENWNLESKKDKWKHETKEEIWKHENNEGYEECELECSLYDEGIDMRESARVI